MTEPLSRALAGPDRLVTGILGLSAVGLTAAANGAVLPTAWGWSALGLLLATAWGLGFRRRLELTRVEWGVLGGVTSFLLWIALSTVWSASSPRTVDEIERSIIYLAALAALFVLGSPRSLPYLLGGVLAATVGISAVALGIWFTGPAEHHPLQGSLPSWNALGVLTAIGLILALGFASAQLPRELRLGAAASLPLLAATLYLTHSRGGFLALCVGLLAFAFLHPVLAGGRRRIAVLAVVVLALAALGVGIVQAGGPGALLGKTIESVRSPPAPEGRPSERLLTLSSNMRTDYWRVAWAQYRAHPWLGSGAGTFALYWNRDRETIYYSHDAHNVYLETAAELGPFGLLLLVGTLALPFLGLRAARREPLLAAAAGAYIAFLLHAGVDWDWEVPAVTLAGLACGGGLVLAARAERRPVSGTLRTVALGAVAILVAFVLVAYRGNLAAGASREAAYRGDFRRAEQTARTATRWMPWSSEAWLSLGEAQLALGDTRGARESFETGLERDPLEWRLWYKLAVASSGAEREEALAEAARLNQYSAEVRALQGE
jgi:O-antigen ligase